MRIINPNDVDLSITGFSFHLDINDTRFTRGVSNESFIVPRLGESKTSVVVTTSVLDIFRQLAAFDKKHNTDYLIKGKVYLGGSRVSSVPFRHGGKLLRD
ncbi:MAG: LEA type 2 family protein [Mariprofundaceae bacterium]|nr:LEA type 2 family protein [Mariprofundaceae bacterium]